MTFEGSPGVPSVATQETEAIQFSGELFLANQGLESLASVQIEAHGQSVTLSQALELCPPLVNMVESLAVSLKEVPDHENIIKKALESAATTAQSELPDEAKKK